MDMNEVMHLEIGESGNAVHTGHRPVTVKITGTSVSVSVTAYEPLEKVSEVAQGLLVLGVDLGLDQRPNPFQRKVKERISSYTDQPKHGETEDSFRDPPLES